MIILLLLAILALLVLPDLYTRSTEQKKLLQSTNATIWVYGLHKLQHPIR